MPPSAQSIRRLKGALIPLMAAGAGGILGRLIISPNRRVIEAAMGALLVALCVRFPLFWSVAVFTVLQLFPLGLSIGNTNVLLVLVMWCVWFFRASLGGERPSFRTGLDAPVILLLGAFVVSLFAINSPALLARALPNFGIMVGCIMYFYLIVNFVRTDEGLERVVTFMCVGAFLMMLTGVYQAFFPGRPLIPGWIIPEADPSLLKGEEGLRIGAAFQSHDVLSDYSAAMIPIEIMMFTRARTLGQRSWWMVLMGLTVFSILATANRGGMVGLVLGLAYLTYRTRRDVRFVPLVLSVAGGVAVLWLLSEILADFTETASMFDRLLGTKFYGVVPDTRRGIWSAAFEKALTRPLVGHGPYYDITTTVSSVYWPHNSFIFAFYTTGIVGAVALAWVFIALILRSHAYAGDSLRDPSFSKSLMVVLHVQMLTFTVGQMRTDYQRDATYMFVAWLTFGLIAATALIRERAIAAERAHASRRAA